MGKDTMNPLEINKPLALKNASTYHKMNHENLDTLSTFKLKQIANEQGIVFPEDISKYDLLQILKIAATNQYTGFDISKLPSGEDLQKWDVKIEYLVGKYLPKQAITILHGSGGIGKTWLAFQIAEAVATGNEFLGNKSEQASVCYIDFENPSPVLVDRARQLNIQHTKFWHISNADKAPPLLDSKDAALYEKLPADSLLIFDTMRSAHGGDENSSRDIAGVLATLKRLREKGFTLLLLHHTAKGNNQKYKGSTAILDLADHELNLCEADKKEGSQDHYYKLHTPQKSRYKTDEITLDFDLDQGGFFPIPNEADKHIKTVYELIIEVPEDFRKKTKLVDLIREKTGLSKNNARNLLDNGTGNYWFVESRPGEKNSFVYSANPDVQFSGPYRETTNRKTENDASSNAIHPTSNQIDTVASELSSFSTSLLKTENQVLDDEIPDFDF